MPFVPTKAHALIAETVRGALVARGFDVLRADDRAYSEDLFRNIEAYIHGCRFAVAVFDRILKDRHNVNVAIETGYCLALRKPLCLLKEKTVKKLPTDLVGRLYVEFDAQSIQETVPTALERWLTERALLPRKEKS